MPQPQKGPRLGGGPAHHNMMVANLATELFRHGRIRTTKAKAKAMQPTAERMITFAKRGDLHARRQVLKVIRDKDVVHKLFADIGPAVADRNGGYTRVTKLGPRKGDAAEMAMIELVDALGGEDTHDLTEAPRRRWSLRRRRGTVSRSAREREEQIAAEVDRGDMGGDEEFDEAPAAPSARAEEISERTLAAADAAGAADRADDEDGEGGPEVTPEQVAARLEAEDEADAEVEDQDVADADDAAADADDAAADADDADTDDEE